MDDLSQILAEVQRVPRLQSLSGIYVGLVSGEPTVDLGGSRVPAAWVCPPVATGTRVTVWLLGTAAFIVSTTSPRPSEGTVSTVTGDTVSLTTDYGPLSGVPYLAGYAPASGHIVALLWTVRGPVVLGRLSNTIPPAPAPVPPPPAAVRVQRNELFTATGSGSAARGSSNWFTNQVYASSSNIGIFTYGAKVRDSLAGAVSVESIDIYLPALRDSGNAPSLGHHLLESVGQPTPVISAQRSISPRSGWVNITDLADRLKSGGGIGFDGNGFTIYAGVPSGGRPGDDQAGALRIKYTT